MKRFLPLALSITASAILTACSSSSNSGSTAQNFTLRGSVPGTLIEAFCQDGSYRFTHSNNTGSKEHPFSLSLPTDTSCMLVFVTNEDDVENKVVTPVSMVLPNGQTSSSFRGRGDIVDIGFVPLPMSRNDMLSDTNLDGVEDIPREIKLGDESANSIEIALEYGHSLLDSDGDGIVNDYEDTDGDRKPNRDDDDDDGDGIKDSEDHDRDNDGQDDDDLDGDGVPNREDVDDDNDGEPDESDDDHDDDEEDEDENEDSDDKEDEDNDEGDEGSAGDLVTPVSGAPSAGRLLASQCAQCHGTDGHSVSGIDSLAGEGRSEIIEEMLEMHSEGDRDIMSLQARGYTRAEIEQLAEYLGSIRGGN